MGNSIYGFVKNTLLDNFLKLARVNVLTGEYEFMKYDVVMREEGYEDISSIYHYIEKQVSDGLILSGYVGEYLKFANPEYVQRRVFSGDRRIIQSYKRKVHGGYMWITFGIIVPDECDWEHPQVVFYWREADSDTITMVDALSTLSEIYSKILKINLTTDSFQVIKVSEYERTRFANRLSRITDWWREFGESGHVHEEDLEVYREFTDAERLRTVFRADSVGAQSCRYRRLVGDSYRWAQTELMPSIEYEDDNQVLILYIKDIHDEHLREMRNRQALLDGYHRDALTRLFNRHKYNEDLKELSKDVEGHLSCMYADVNGLHELNNHLGHEKGDDMLCSVADTLKRFFPEETVYRIGGDEFVMLSTKLSKESVEHIMVEVRRELLQDNYEIAVGVKDGPCELGAYKIVGAAELAMREDKGRYYRENGRDRRRRVLNEELEKTLEAKKYAERFLDVISDKYAGVYFVDLQKDSLQHIYIPEYFLRLLEDADYSYSKAMRLYIDRYVKEEYQPRLLRMIDYDELTRLLRTEAQGDLSLIYQKVDGKYVSLRIMEMDRYTEEKYETIWIFSEKVFQTDDPVKLFQGGN